MRTAPIVAVFCVALGLAGLLAACGKGPTQPSAGLTSTPTPASGAFITRLEIAGPGSVPPGQTAQFNATAILSDGSTRDVTNEARWSSSNGSVLSMSASSGLATGRERGEVIISCQVNNIRSSREVVVVPAGTYRLAGLVTEVGVAGAPVAGALLEVRAGPGVDLAVTTGWDGRYRLYGVPADAEVRVSKDGYEPQVQRLQLTDHVTLNVQLALSRARPDISGTYTLTIAVVGGCTGSNALPEDLRQRTYTAVLSQDGPQVEVTLTGADFVINSIGNGNRFRGRVDPAGATFQLSTGDLYYYYGPAYYPDVVERLPNTTFLVVSGVATTTISQSGLSGTLNGSLVTYDARFPRNFTLSWCGTAAHRFNLSR